MILSWPNCRTLTRSGARRWHCTPSRPISIREAWFADREKHGPFRWAVSNLDEVERNKRDKRTVPWRYTILRLHEAVEKIVPHLTEQDRERFKSGLARIFIDNYAAIPSQSIRRLLALREAGIISILTLGPDYELALKEDRTVIHAQGKAWYFDVFIDARGQQPLKTKDLPFPSCATSWSLPEKISPRWATITPCSPLTTCAEKLPSALCRT
ncbi:Uncharacterized protein conserved in bacteria [Leclercia adecarboxylata]|uniref:Uncharacterized protein conserved in bacteria n=1 Tax=Leclercia adecarboxylata TaxID=83655 RepID=A0A4U9HS25_9ENTR|nr:Uncharacterized protein conserved in bacteria [Leclercia adecarboxylata]